MKKKILYFLILCLFINCKKEKSKIDKQTKIEQVYAENDYGMFGGRINLKIYSDSTYICEKKEKSYDYEKSEVFNGAYKIVNDTINFFPSNFRPIDATKALIKNNFIEFIDGEFPLKIEIKKNMLKSKQHLNFDKFNSYAVFTFNEKFNRNLFYNSKPKSVKPYDLKQNELKQLHTILNKCFLENQTKLNKESDYVKQCVAVKNSKNEIEVWIACYCKDNSIGNGYKYSLIDMSDGGNCNISLKINLTKHIYTELNISGSA
jgi:hypothetical protein